MKMIKEDDSLFNLDLIESIDIHDKPDEVRESDHWYEVTIHMNSGKEFDIAFPNKDERDHFMKRVEFHFGGFK